MLVISMKEKEQVYIDDDILVCNAIIKNKGAYFDLNKKSGFTLQVGQERTIMPNVKIKLVEASRSRVKLGFTAPKEISIQRGVVHGRNKNNSR